MLKYFRPWRSTTKGFLKMAFEVPGSINYIFSLTTRLSERARKLKYGMHIYLETYGSTKKGFSLNVAFEVPVHTLYLFSLHILTSKERRSLNKVLVCKLSLIEEM